MKILRLEVEQQGESRTYEFSSEVVTLGSAPGCSVTIEDAAVAAEHCQIFQSARGFMVEDLGHDGGTLLNDEPVETKRLTEGDRIRIGACTIRILPAAVETPPPAPDPSPGPPATQAPASGRSAPDESGRPKASRSDKVPPNYELAFVLKGVAGSHRGKELTCIRSPFVIGSEPGCDLTLDGPDVGARHAEIIRRQNRFTLVHVASTGETEVDGDVVGRQELSSGAMITIGAHAFKFQKVKYKKSTRLSTADAAEPKTTEPREAEPKTVEPKTVEPKATETKPSPPGRRGRTAESAPNKKASPQGEPEPAGDASPQPEAGEEERPAAGEEAEYQRGFQSEVVASIDRLDHEQAMARAARARLVSMAIGVGVLVVLVAVGGRLLLGRIQRGAELVAQTSDEVNMLADGSFEEGTGWTLPAGATLDRQVVRHGRQALRVEATGELIEVASEEISITQDGVLALKGYVFLSGDGPAGVRLSWTPLPDAPAEVINFPLTISPGWHEIDDWCLVPGGVGAIRVQCVVAPGSTAWFDGLRLAPAPAEAAEMVADIHGLALFSEGRGRFSLVDGQDWLLESIVLQHGGEEELFPHGDAGPTSVGDHSFSGQLLVDGRMVPYVGTVSSAFTATGWVPEGWRTVGIEVASPEVGDLALSAAMVRDLRPVSRIDGEGSLVEVELPATGLTGELVFGDADEQLSLVVGGDDTIALARDRGGYSIVVSAGADGKLELRLATLSPGLRALFEARWQTAQDAESAGRLGEALAAFTSLERSLAFTSGERQVAAERRASLAGRKEAMERSLAAMRRDVELLTSVSVGGPVVPWPLSVRVEALEQQLREQFPTAAPRTQAIPPGASRHPWGQDWDLRCLKAARDELAAGRLVEARALLDAIWEQEAAEVQALRRELDMHLGVSGWRRE